MTTGQIVVILFGLLTLFIFLDYCDKKRNKEKVFYEVIKQLIEKDFVNIYRYPGAYQKSIEAVVELLRSHGLVMIEDAIVGTDTILHQGRLRDWREKIDIHGEKAVMTAMGSEAFSLKREETIKKLEGFFFEGIFS